MSENTQQQQITNIAQGRTHLHISVQQQQKHPKPLLKHANFSNVLRCIV